MSGTLSAETDAVVVGAGPAGSVAAIKLAQAGFKVALLEKAPVPRDKVCGDGLIPDSLAVFEEIGLLDEVCAAGQESRGVRIYSPDGTGVDVPGRCLCLRREVLDAMLVRAACQAGAELSCETEALSYTASEKSAKLRVRIRGREEKDISTRIVILACGAASKILSRFELQHRSRPSAVAFRAYYRLDESIPEDWLHIWFEKPVLPGYAWIFPVGQHEFNVGAGVVYENGNGAAPNLRVILERFRSDCPTARKMLAQGQPLTKFKGAPLRTRLEGCQMVSNRLLVCGEAIGATYPFSGEGIGKAMETGVIAAQTAASGLRTDRLSGHDLAVYPKVLRSELGPKFRHYAIAQQWMKYPWVANFVTHRARKNKRVRDILSGVLNETAEPTELLSFSGLLKAVLR